jgi:LysM repeat protein
LTMVYVAPAASPTTGGASAAATYTIVKGDTWDGIAKKNGIKTKELTAANPTINPAKIDIGQVVNLPPNAKKSQGVK